MVMMKLRSSQGKIQAEAKTNNYSTRIIKGLLLKYDAVMSD